MHFQIWIVYFSEREHIGNKLQGPRMLHFLFVRRDSRAILGVVRCHMSKFHCPCSLTVAKQPAWSGEALCQGLMANIGWLHGEGARIRLPAPGNPTNDLLEVDGVPSHAKAEKSFCNTGTLRGHRNNLYNYGRTGLATSEITESDGLPSAEFAQKSHINKWCHSESDRSATGNLRDSNESYSFYHLVNGQVGLHWKSSQVAMLRTLGS